MGIILEEEITGIIVIHSRSGLITSYTLRFWKFLKVHFNNFTTWYGESQSQINNSFINNFTFEN